MSSNSGETIDWNRTPGKPSFTNNPNPQSQFAPPGPWIEDMWGNSGGAANLLGPQRTAKSWASNPHELIDPSFSHHHQQNSSMAAAAAWNNSNNTGGIPVSSAFPVGIPPWGGAATSVPGPANPSAMRPIRGPQPPVQMPMNQIGDARNSRQFSGWGGIDNMKQDDGYNNLDPVNTNLMSSAGSNASSSSNRNSKDPNKPESSITLLNEMLNNLTTNGTSGSGDGAQTMELEEIVKSLINVNDAWGQRAVDQTTSWDISSISQDEVQQATGNSNPPAAQPQQPPTQQQNHFGNAQPVGVPPQSHQPPQIQQPGNPQQQRRIKPMSHAIGGAAGQLESNVWQNEPPNGTGIWEAHYESLGEKNSLEWATTGNSIHHLPHHSHNQLPGHHLASGAGGVAGGAMNPLGPQKPGPPIGNRPINFNPMNRQSNIGYRQQPGVPGNPASAWNELDSGNMWNQHPDIMLNPGAGAGPGSGRPINKVGSSTGLGSGNAPWPPSTNHPPPPNDVFSPSTWNSSQSQLNSLNDGRKFPGSTANPSATPSANGPQGIWPPDYRSMIRHPPPTNSSNAGGGGASMRGNAPGSGMGPMGGQPLGGQVPGMNNSMSSGFFRANVLRQLIKLGFSEEEVQNTMVENNMDIERTVNELRSKSSHIGIDALLNPIMGSNLFQPNSGSPPPLDEPKISTSGNNNDPSNANVKMSENILIKQIVQWHKRSSEMNQKISQLLHLCPSSSLAVKELTQRRDQAIQQIIVFQSQLASLRNMNAQLTGGSAPRPDDLSDRFGDLRVRPSSNAWDTNAFWSAPPDPPSEGTGVPGASLAPGADRRWSNNNDPVVMPSANNLNQQQPINRQPWPSKTNQDPGSEGKGPSRWILIRNLLSHITIDILKMNLNSTLGEMSPMQSIDYEIDPNMTSRWCLLTFPSANEAVQFMKHLLYNEGSATRTMGTYEFLTQSEVSECMMEIQNLNSQVFGNSSPSPTSSEIQKKEDDEQEAGLRKEDSQPNPDNATVNNDSNSNPECQKIKTDESPAGSQSPNGNCNDS